MAGKPNKLDLLFYVHTIIKMKITFNSSKDAINIAKHGVSLAKASLLGWDSALVWPDLRKE